MRPPLAPALVLALLLAGCTGLDLPTRADVSPAGRDAPVEGAPTFLAADPVPDPVARLPANVTLERAWLRPYQPASATLATVAGADVSWFLQAETDDVKLTFARGTVYASKAATPQAHHHHAGEADDHDEAPAAPARRHADIASLPAGGRPHALVFALEGRFLLETPAGARLNVTVRPEAGRGPTDAFLMGSAGATRFVPDELDVPPGARVLVWNQASEETSVREKAYLTRLPGDADGATFVPIDEGLWRLHAVVRDGPRAFGTGGAPFLVDYERPAERNDIGPMRGRFDQADAALPGAEERSLSLSATHPLDRLALFFNATSALPAPGAVRVLVVLEGQTLGEASSLETGTLELTSLPAGRYDLVVRGERGQLVDYELEGIATYRLPTPARLADAR